MKKYIISALFLSVFAIACNSNESKKEDAVADKDATSTTTTTSEPAPVVLDSATMMKNWMAYMTPGDVHKMIASWDGTWNGNVTMWQMPGAPPQMSKSTATNKTIMGGRYQVSNHKGNMMGMPFEGMSTLAYDNAKKTFISTWIDNMGTGMMMMEGTWDDASKTINLTGKAVDPSAGTGKEMTVRETFKIMDDKNQLMEMYGPGPDGKEFKMMEIKFSKN
jgi:hypothetical protein